MIGRVLLTGASVLAITGGMMMTSKKSPPRFSEVVPQTIPMVDYPDTTQIRKHLTNRTIQIGGETYTFLGNDINYMNIVTIQPVNEKRVVIDVKVKANHNLVLKQGLKQTQIKENVCGTLRINYENRNTEWICTSIENIDLQKN